MLFGYKIPHLFQIFQLLTLVFAGLFNFSPGIFFLYISLQQNPGDHDFAVQGQTTSGNMVNQLLLLLMVN